MTEREYYAKRDEYSRSDAPRDVIDAAIRVLDERFRKQNHDDVRKDMLECMPDTSDIGNE